MPASFDSAGLMRDSAICKFTSFLRAMTGDKYAGLDVRCYDDALEFISEKHDHAKLLERIDKTFPTGATKKAFNKLLKVPLYPYQRKGT